jgi:hypothetical protein
MLTTDKRFLIRAKLLTYGVTIKSWKLYSPEQKAKLIKRINDDYPSTTFDKIQSAIENAISN